jgi:diguanylate cyclase (GGDEF)-like protein/PAS domain S-box-containing protein
MSASVRVSPLHGSLIALLAAFVLPTLLFSGIVTHRWVRSEQQRLAERTREVNDDVVALVDSHLATQISALEALATSPALDTGELHRFDQQARALVARTGTHIVMRDPAGQQVVNTRLPWGSPLPPAPTETDRLVIGSRQPQVSDIVIGAVTRTPLVLVTVPVLRGGEVVSILDASIPPGAIASLIGEARIEAPLSATVADRKGLIIARSEASDTFVGRPHPEFGQASGQRGTWSGTDPSGVPVTGHYRRSSLSGWLVTVGVETSVLQAPLTRSLWLLGALAVVLGTVAVAGSVLVGRRIIHAQRRVTEAEALYHLLVENTNDMIVRADPASKRLYVSPASLEVIGYTPEELIGTDPRDFVHPDDADGLKGKLAQLHQGAADRVRSIHRFRHKSGSWVWVEANFRLLRSPSGEPQEIVSIVRDISDRVRLEEQLRELAQTDGLTGLANRRSFDERLEQEWRRAERIGESLALIVLDVDFFKRYNDRFGHAQGDECLRRVAGILAGGRRISDMAARIGGEEFCLILPNTDGQGAVLVAEAIRSGVEMLRMDHPESPLGRVTVSVGAAAARPRRDDTASALLAAADRALYDAKGAGRNRVGTAAPAAEAL